MKMEETTIKTERENTENNFIDGNEVVDTGKKRWMARKHKYYDTRGEAEAKRRKGDRIYYKPEHGYYLVRPKKRKWWDIF